MLWHVLVLTAALSPLFVTSNSESYSLLPHCAQTAKSATSWPQHVRLRCAVVAKPDDHLTWILSLGLNVERATLRTTTASGTLVTRTTGMRVPYAQRPAQYYVPSFVLDNETLSGRPFEVDVDYYPDSPLRVSVRSEHRLLTYANPFQFVEWLFYGVLLAVAFFNLYVFAITRERATLFYVAYIVALICNEAVSTGTGGHYFWPWFAGPYRWLALATATAAFGTFYLFTRSFLQLERALPIWNRILLSAFLLITASGICVAAFAWAAVLQVPLLFVQLAALLLTVSAGIIRWRQGFAAARFFVIGFIPNMIGIFGNLAYNIFVPPGNFFLAENGVELGTVFLSIILSFSLLDRIRILDRARQAADAELAEVSQEASRLHVLALHDPLTGLANRILFTEELGRALLRANRKNTLVGVLYADLDGFKPVNDVYGHRVGDEVLRIVAQRLKDGLREADLTARLGGDEFAIIIEDLQVADQALQVCESVGALLETPVRVASTEIPIGISVGCSIYPTDGASVDQLLHEADLRMYKAKAAHKAALL